MHKKEEKAAEYAFLFLLLCQLGGVVYFNLSDIRCSLDHDTANVIYWFMEIIRNGTIRLQDWIGTTNLGLDGVGMFALPLYYLIHNIYLAMGISNILFVGIYLFVIERIMAHAGVRKVFTYLAMCLVITPHAFGMLDYFNMLFFGNASYTVRVLVPLLFLLLLQLLGENAFSQKGRKFELAVVAVLYTLFTFMMTFSSGMAVFVCGILPLAVCMALDIWTDGGNARKYTWGHLGLLAGTLIVSFAGSALHSYYWTGVSAENNLLTKTENYAVNFRACVAGVFQVFGALTSQDIRAFSVWGIVYCLKMAFVVSLLVVLFCNITLLFKKTEKISIKKYLTFLFVFIFALFVVVECRFPGNTRMEYRYFLIGAVPLILLLGMQMETWARNWKAFQQRTAYVCLFIALAVLLAGNTKNVYDHWDRSTYAVELCDYFNTLDIESVFFINDDTTAKICKGIDMDHKYGAYDTGTQSFVWSMCSYSQSMSGAFYGRKNVMAVITGNHLEDLFPAEIASRYEWIGTIRWYDIYYSDEVYFP